MYSWKFMINEFYDFILHYAIVHYMKLFCDSLLADHQDCVQSIILNFFETTHFQFRLFCLDIVTEAFVM